jgi:hypothetical protein
LLSIRNLLRSNRNLMRSNLVLLVANLLRNLRLNSYILTVNRLLHCWLNELSLRISTLHWYVLNHSWGIHHHSLLRVLLESSAPVSTAIPSLATHHHSLLKLISTHHWLLHLRHCKTHCHVLMTPLSGCLIHELVLKVVPRLGLHHDPLSWHVLLHDWHCISIVDSHSLLNTSLSCLVLESVKHIHV